MIYFTEVIEVISERNILLTLQEITAGFIRKGHINSSELVDVIRVKLYKMVKRQQLSRLKILGEHKYWYGLKEWKKEGNFLEYYFPIGLYDRMNDAVEFEKAGLLKPKETAKIMQRPKSEYSNASPYGIASAALLEKEIETCSLMGRAKTMKLYWLKQQVNLSDVYIRHSLKGRGYPNEEITEELIEEYRAYIKKYREISNEKSEAVQKIIKKMNSNNFFAKTAKVNQYSMAIKITNNRASNKNKKLS